MRTRTGLAITGGLLMAGVGLAPLPAQAAVTAPSDTYEISVGTGTQLTGTNDTGIHCQYSACGAYVSAPFSIKAYGNLYSQVYLSSYGTVQFEGAQDYQVNSSLPSGNFSGPTFLPLWDSWYTGDAGSTSYGVFTRTVGAAPNRKFVVEWRVYNGNDGRYTFAQTFAEGTGLVTTTYGNTPGSAGGLGTVGAQNGSASSQYSYNQTDAVYPGLQITYTPTRVLSVPDAPQDPETTVFDKNSSTLFWDTPASDGGSTITGYRVHRDGRSTTGGGEYTSGVLPADQRSFNFRNLFPGSTYTFDVVAINAQGVSQPAYASVTQPSSVPSAPVIGSASPGTPGGTIQARARWSAPSSTGGAAITGYRVYAYRVVNGSTVQSTASPVLAKVAREFNMTLPQKGQWKFRVVAINNNGTSPYSAYSNTVAAR